jgi:hypothetical protein
VRPAELHSAEPLQSGYRQNYDSGQNVRWAHRLKVCVPARQMLTRAAEAEQPNGLKLIAHCSFKRSGYQVRDASKRFVHATRVD